VRPHWTMAAVAPAAPALNLQRPLVASTDSQHAAGQFSVRRNGEVQHIRVLQEAERQDVNIRKIRWVFSEGADTYQIELRHGRVSGVRKLFINRASVDAVRYSMNSEARSSMTFYLDDREGQPVHKACVVISKERGFDYTYQLLIDDYPIQLMSKEDDAVETPRGLMPSSPRVSPSPRVAKPQRPSLRSARPARQCSAPSRLASAIPRPSGPQRRWLRAVTS